MKMRSEKSIGAVCAALPEAVTSRGFGIMVTHDLKETMARKGVAFERDCRVFEVCNPQQASRVLEANMDLSTVLPCRISVYDEDGKTVLSAVRPTAMLGALDGDGAAEVAEEVEVTMAAIMVDAARGF